MCVCVCVCVCVSFSLFLRCVPQDCWSSTALSGTANVWRNRQRVALDLISNWKWWRSTGFFGEPLNHVLTTRGQILVGRTYDDLLPPRVYVQQSPPCVKLMCAWCRHSRGRFECTHGGVFESTHRFFHVFFSVPQYTQTRTHKHNTTTHTTTRRQRQRETETDREREKERRREKRERERDRDRQKQRETEKERDRERETRQEKRRNEKMKEERREKTREERREEERQEKRQDEEERRRKTSEETRWRKREKMKEKMKRDKEWKKNVFSKMFEDPQTRQMN